MLFHKQNVLVLIFLAFMLSLSVGCIDPPDYPDEPVLTEVIVSRDTLTQFDTFSVTFSFTDGDGDIGFQEYFVDSQACNPCNGECLEEDDLTLFVIDSRTNCLVQYNVPYVPPKGSSESISGEITFESSQICCLPPSGFPCTFDPTYPVDTFSLRIQLRDRGGRFSNIVSTSRLTVLCDQR